MRLLFYFISSDGGNEVDAFRFIGELTLFSVNFSGESQPSSAIISMWMRVHVTIHFIHPLISFTALESHLFRSICTQFCFCRGRVSSSCQFSFSLRRFHWPRSIHTIKSNHLFLLISITSVLRTPTKKRLERSVKYDRQFQCHVKRRSIESRE